MEGAEVQGERVQKTGGAGNLPAPVGNLPNGTAESNSVQAAFL
jgi:hypothetical protein